jgi:cation diffusion facilitator family transporter
MHNRPSQVRHGLYLSIFTIAWNILEGVVAVASGLAAGSVALLGFGIDSFVESASAIVVGWRFSYEMSGRSQEQTEKAELWAARIAGTLLLILAIYLLIDSARRIFGLGCEPESSPVGIGLTTISLVIMPMLARAKMRVADRLGSRALRADSYETVTCAWLSATTLAGLILNAAFGWWWADPVAALALIPLIVREGLEGLRSEAE